MKIWDDRLICVTIIFEYISFISILHSISFATKNKFLLLGVLMNLTILFGQIEIYEECMIWKNNEFIKLNILIILRLTTIINSYIISKYYDRN